MDRLRSISAKLFLTDEATINQNLPPSFLRRVTSEGKHAPSSLLLTLGLGNYHFLRIIAHRLDDGRWRVSCIDCNLPGHLYGHNARPIRNDYDLALALTRVKYFVSLVVEPDCHGRIIPGVGIGNNSFITYAEPMIQIQDPKHCFLIASHVASMRYQHKSPMVVWGESTIFKSREIVVSFYDKLAQRKTGFPDPILIDSTRIESILKNHKRLATEVRSTGEYAGPPGEVVSTLSLHTAYALIRQNLGRLSGFGAQPDDTLGKLSTPAKLLLMGLGPRLDQPQAIDQALEHYRRSQSPCPRTFSSVCREVRAHAHAWITPDTATLVPPDFNDLKWSDVRMPDTEARFQVLLRDLGAPSVPDPQILEAWSRTTFLKRKPNGFDLAGECMPSPATPWKNTL